MNAKNFFKRMIPAVVAGAAALVLAMPMTAMAHDWDHHDNGRHMGWFHRDHDGDDCNFRPRAFYPREHNEGYYPPPSYPIVSPPIYQPYGYGYGNGRGNYLQQKWAQAEAKHQAALASGNHRKARLTSERLYQLDRQMGVNGRYAASPYYGQGYGQNGSVLGNMFGLW